MDIITKPVIGSEIIDSGGNLSGASTGAPCRSERTAKRNRLLMTEDVLILILNQPIDKLSAIISSFRVKLPCQATACLRSLSLTELILSVDFVYRTIEN